MAKARSRGIVNIASEQDWQTEEDLRCFQRYCEVKKDKKRLARVRALAKERLTEMASITAKTGEDDDD